MISVKVSEHPHINQFVKLVTNVVVWLGIIVLSLFLLFVYGPLLLDWSSHIVLSPSMEPTIQTGSIVVVRPIEPIALKQNDIAMYRKDKALILHRIQQIDKKNDQTLFVFKGDANKYADFEQVNEKQIVGKLVYSIPYAGYVVKYAHDNKMLLFILIALAFIIVNTTFAHREHQQKLHEIRKIDKDLPKIS
ncbi:signal peptidase I [Bacillus alveayuensis]|uniref:signal peptidase I n=1 Tax=Aeribacillus alveayuensis TaxID=279215 RepID=UPI0006992354|nr:signal peptidase I [Bacillus alveayuensis]